MINHKNATAVMSYLNNKKDESVIQLLWIKQITQPNSLTGVIYQSKYTRHFYPRFYSPGNYTITCIADSQARYQEVGKYIRDYHQFISNTVVNSNQVNQNKKNNRTYINLVIPSEQINVKGVPDRIQIAKRGVFDPVPIFSFDFIILENLHKVTNYSISNSIKTWYDINLDNPYNNPNGPIKT